MISIVKFTILYIILLYYYKSCITSWYEFINFSLHIIIIYFSLIQIKTKYYNFPISDTNLVGVKNIKLESTNINNINHSKTKLKSKNKMFNLIDL
jgi:hypothetical protein